MEVEVFNGSDLPVDLILLWKDFQASNVSLESPFFCYEFISIVSGFRNDVFIAVIRDFGRVICFFPFTKGLFGIARPVGVGISDYHGYISKEDVSFEVSKILQKIGLSRWSYDHLVEQQACSFSQQNTYDHSAIVDISKGFESYIHELDNSGSKIHTKIERWQRKLEKEFGPIRVEFFSKDPVLLNLCIEGKKRQFLNSGVEDPFSHPWVVAVLKEIQQRESKEFSGMLSVLYAGDNVIATHMGMRSEMVWHYWFPTYDHAYAKFSPGLILLYAIIKKAPDLGIKYIDLGKGRSQYKDRFKNAEISIVEGVSVADKVGVNIFFKGISKYEKWFVKKGNRMRFLRLPIRFIDRVKRKNRFK